MRILCTLEKCLSLKDFLKVQLYVLFKNVILGSKIHIEKAVFPPFSAIRNSQEIMISAPCWNVKTNRIGFGSRSPLGAQKGLP